MSDQETSNNKEIMVEGVIESVDDKLARLLDPKYHGKPRPADPLIPRDLIRRFKLKAGSYIVGKAHQNDQSKNPNVFYICSIDGLSVDERKDCLVFTQLTTITPNKRLTLETKDGRMTNRVIDLFCPIGKGQRGLIVSPPRAGKTTLLQDIAVGVQENHPECHVMILLVDERPEEVTDFRRSIDAEIFSSSNDDNIASHIRVAELAIERAKNLVEAGKDVVLLLDSLTRLARAYNSATSKGGRTMTGGLDIRALEKPRQLFSAARNTEEAGSLTIIASALVETGSRMDDLIFQEFKGTGNMEMVLDRKLAEMRIWPAVDILASGTRREELLFDPKTLEKIHFFRRALTSLKPGDAAETLIARMSKTKNNDEFLRLLSA